MSKNTLVPLSMLDLAVVTQGCNAQDAIGRTVRMAQLAEQLNFKRIWLAEHHNMEHIASAATAVLISHIANHTQTIRVGSGGIMLPNHSPYIIAEQFGTLETIFPGRIDLGLGRAPGTDQRTAMAIRRKNYEPYQYDFHQDVLLLQQYFSKDNANAMVRAFPGEGLNIPLWILGSSTDSAHLAAAMGLPYAFAAHFAPAMLEQAMQIYFQQFKASQYLQQPYAIACVNVIAADSDDEAEQLATSIKKMFIGILTNQRAPLSPPTNDIFLTPAMEAEINKMLSCTFVGSQQSIKHQITEFLKKVPVNELMVSSNIYDEDAKVKSFEILHQALSK